MYYDRFDIVQAYYFYFRDYHAGQTSKDFERLCKIKTYWKPNRHDLEHLSDNARLIYNQLIGE